jgi:hypothetical protein
VAQQPAKRAVKVTLVFIKKNSRTLRVENKMNAQARRKSRGGRVEEEDHSKKETGQINITYS